MGVPIHKHEGIVMGALVRRPQGDALPALDRFEITEVVDLSYGEVERTIARLWRAGAIVATHDGPRAVFSAAEEFDWLGSDA